MAMTFAAARRRALLPGLILAVVVAVLPPCAVAAAPLEEVRVAVDDKSPGTREEAFTRALERVLVRLTGRRIPAGAPAWEALKASAGTHVQAYRYEEGPEGGHRLWVRFDREALEGLAGEAGWDLWDAQRPSLMVWMVVQEGVNRHLVAEDDSGGVRRQLAAVARARGLPLIFPLMDPEDWRRVSPAHVVGGFTGSLREAADRYASDGMLVAHLHAEGEGWQGRFRLSLRGAPLGERRFQSRQRDEVLEQGVHWAADAVRGQDPARGDDNGPGILEVTVMDVVDHAAYLRARDRLARLDPVREVVPGHLAPERVRFRLRLRGDAAELERAVRRDPFLAVIPSEETTDGPASVPAFRLLQ
ncbi:DUF2066 domain-containing protein [Ectothiorhodospira mobilis]|uniref:DUF2066 domain-containing protein n=1 Tax=Ectothiorhodospira mobilis TaxID=195064 RepID=UPI001903CB5F|nr:DUF2066 domain-containing protein [Ectothiorhodospira mobilis]